MYVRIFGAEDVQKMACDMRSNATGPKMATEKKYVETPLMKQYYSIKAVHPDAILLFRVGDFFETFGEDAIKTSGILGITLTKRANGAASSVELAGFPHHALDTYLPKLVRAGERVAICEQLEDPKTVKTIVKRGVIELVTPGTAMGDNVLQAKANNFLAAVHFGQGSTGVAFLDISTGEFLAAEGSDHYVDKLISNLAPKEILYERGNEERFKALFGTQTHTYRLDTWVFNYQTNKEKLCKQFGTTSLKGFGIEGLDHAVSAAGAILYYLDFTEHKNISHVNAISRIDQDGYVWLDRFTIRNLELFHSNNAQGKGSLAQTLDRTLSPMGGRLLRRWIAMPVRDIDEIDRRLDAVEALKDDAVLREELGEAIARVGDLERLAGRVATLRITPREVVQLSRSLEATERIGGLLRQSGKKALEALAAGLDPCMAVRERIDKGLFPDPPNMLNKGGVVAPGVDMELDDLRRALHHGKEVIASIQQRESEATGIPLKISFNNVFGYYIEVRNAHKEKVPLEWIRKQTLTSAERYITPELKEYEEKILGAEGRILEIETRIYGELLAFLAGWLGKLQKNAGLVARIDCLDSFAVMASERGYCRPVIDRSQELDIKGGRHPVIETLLPVGEQYIPNDVELNDKDQQIIIITGPNMAGKSALLRQTALIVLMAQTGSFVPAQSARIGLIDRIFTRVGASDNLTEGESTFMVEMLESANILNNISERSLILLDEIGRGTSTYDGMSIAWAIVEYIHNHPKRAKTLFATHYHQLNEMEELLPRVKNFNVTVKEVGNSVVFLRKLVRGGTAHSFGIHVARMAGMPRDLVKRAGEVLHDLEGKRPIEAESVLGGSTGSAAAVSGAVPGAKKRKVQQTEIALDGGAIQLSMFQLDDPVLCQIRDQIKKLDINNLTPIEALNMLSEVKKLIGL